MTNEVFVRFAIYVSSWRGAIGYTILCDLDQRILVFRDTRVQETLNEMATISSGSNVDMAKAYAKAAADHQGREFARGFELTVDDIRTLLPLLNVKDYVEFKEHPQKQLPNEESTWCFDDSFGEVTSFEGYVGSATPLFVIKNMNDYCGGMPKFEELHR